MYKFSEFSFAFYYVFFFYFSSSFVHATTNYNFTEEYTLFIKSKESIRFTKISPPKSLKYIDCSNFIPKVNINMEELNIFRQLKRKKEPFLLLLITNLLFFSTIVEAFISTPAQASSMFLSRSPSNNVRSILLKSGRNVFTMDNNIFAENIKHSEEEKKKWLDSLPSIINNISNKWKIYEHKQFSSLSCHYVASAQRRIDNSQVVIKIGMPNFSNIKEEMDALNSYQNKNYIRKLIDYDSTSNALLLEYINPGTSLKSLFPFNDEISIEHTVAIMKDIHSSYIDNNVKFPAVVDWITPFIKNSYLPQSNLVKKAQQISLELLKSQNKSDFTSWRSSSWKYFI
jgi:hypothetical protein